MADFKRGGGFGARRGGGFGGGSGGPRFGGGNFKRGNGGNRERPERFKATCDECKKECELPFRPSGDRPVYCSECFRGKDGGRTNDFPRRDNDRGSFNKRDVFNKPSFNNSPKNSISDKRIEDIEKKIMLMDSKLDQIILAIGSSKKPKAEVIAKVPVKKAKKK